MTKKKLYFLLIFSMMSVLCLSACKGRDRFTDEQMAQIISEGKPILEEFLASLPAKDVQAQKFEMTVAAKEGSLIWGGQYPANAVTVYFTADSKNYQAVVDLGTGITYSNYYMFDLKPHIKRHLKSYCERYGFLGDFEVGDVGTWVTLHFPGMTIDGKSNKTADSYATLENMIPVTFNQTDLEARADAYLHNAPLTEFTISYDMQETELFDPRILADYLRESGNYHGEAIRSKQVASYMIYGRTHYENFPDSGVDAWDIQLELVNKSDQFNYHLVRTDCHKAEKFCFTYVGAEKDGRLENYEQDDWEKFEFPIEIEDGMLRYQGYNASKAATLCFEEKPDESFSRVIYEQKTPKDPLEPGEPEKLVPAESPDGMWYLTLESNPGEYRYSYKFDRIQDLMIE